uniref:Uncharacterized protein n=1 Tax=Anopheles gambiae TaxID=7165 RepID=A0A453YZ83_ANOGA
MANRLEVERSSNTSSPNNSDRSQSTRYVVPAKHVPYRTVPASPYRLGLAGVITLRAYQLSLDNPGYEFHVSLGQFKDGQFKDITVRDSVGTLYVQIAHEQATTHLTLDTICQWFRTFLSIDPQCSTDTKRYLVCTNTPLDSLIDIQLKELEPENEDILSFAYALSATCYQLQRFSELESILQKESLHTLGKLLARHICNGKQITNESPLLHYYANFISGCVMAVKVNRKQCYKFKPSFLQPEPQTHTAKVRQSLQTEYAVLCANSTSATTVLTLENCELYIEESFLSLPDKAVTPNRAWEIAHITHMNAFFEQFVLLHDTSSVRTLHSKARWELQHVAKSCTVGQHRTIRKELERALLRSPVGSGCMHTLITRKAIDNNQLKHGTERFLRTVRERHPYIVINEERLKSSQLYKDVTSTESDAIIYYRDTSSLLFRATIVAQTLAIVPSCEAIFIDNISPKIMQQLAELLPHVAEVYSASLVVLTIVGKLQLSTLQDIAALMPTHPNDASRAAHTTVKVILIEDLPVLSDSFLSVSDLTASCSKELLEQHATVTLYGTRTSLDAVVPFEWESQYESDHLEYLQDVLDLIADEREIPNRHKQAYETIKPWYIERTIDAYQRGATARKYLAQNVYTMHDDYYSMQYYPFDALPRLDRQSAWRERFATALSTAAPSASAHEMLYTDRGCFAFATESGEGNTSHLTWLAGQLQARDPSLYIVRLDVSEVAESIEKLDLRQCLRSFKMNTAVVRMLYSLVSFAERWHDHDRWAQYLGFSEKRGQAELDRNKCYSWAIPSEQMVRLRLFREKFNRKQLVLLLDDVGVLKPDSTQYVMEFCTLLFHYEAVQSIYLSITTHCADEFFIHRFEYKTLRPFSQLDRMRLLHSVLLSRFEAYRQCGQRYQIQLVPFLQCIIQQSCQPCWDVPLLQRMTLELYLPAIERCVDFTSKRVLSDIKLQLPTANPYQLIKTYMEGKLHAATATCSTDGPAIGTAGSPHRNHALLAIYSLELLYHDQLLSAEERSQAEHLLLEFVDRLRSVEIISGVIGNVPRFCNQTTLQYFAAAWLFENRARLSTKRIASFRYRTFWRTSCATLRLLFDLAACADRDGMELHRAICQFSYVRSLDWPIMPMAKRLCATTKDAVGRTALHLLMTVRNMPYMADVAIQNVYVVLLSNMPAELFDAQDDLFNWSAIDYAFFTDEWTSIRSLLWHGAKANVDVWVQQLRTLDLKHLFYKVCQLERHTHTKPCFDTVSTRQFVEEVCCRIARYLHYEKQLYHTTKVKELDDLTALEYCAKNDMYGLFHHLVAVQHCEPVTFFGSHEVNVLYYVGKELFELARKHKAYRILTYLMSSVKISSEELQSISDVTMLTFAIELNSMEVFDRLYRQLCTNYLQHVKITERVIQYPDPRTGSTCTELHIDQTHSNTNAFAEMIAEALYGAKFHFLKHIVQIMPSAITRQLLLATISELKRKLRRLPVEAAPLFDYLIDRTNDLHGTDFLGCNLLHEAVETGCFVLIDCFLSRKFDPLHTCRRGWTVFHHVASAVQDCRTIEVMQHLQLAGCSSMEGNLPYVKGESVFYVALLHSRFKLARMLMHTKCTSSSTHERVSEMLRIVEAIDGSSDFDIENVLKFFKFLQNNTDEDWDEVYAAVWQRLPVV